MCLEKNYIVLIQNRPIYSGLNMAGIKLYWTPYKQINKNTIKFYSDVAFELGGNVQLDPRFITGFVDGEGSFKIGIVENKNYKTGFHIWLSLSISLHVRDRALLEKLQLTLGVGRIGKHDSESIQLQVTSIKDIKKIIEHFDKFPLKTSKFADYKLWKEVYNLIINNEHHTIEGIKKIMAIKAQSNKGLSGKFFEALSHVDPVDRPEVIDQTVDDPYWLAGFTSAEGCFFVLIAKSQTHSTGFVVQLVFILIQHVRDEKLIKSLINFLECGKIYKRGEILEFKVFKFSDIDDKLIPLFKKYPIQGVKAQDFEDLCYVAEMMKDKKHLTSEGLEQIPCRQIKAGMNRGRGE